MNFDELKKNWNNIEEPDLDIQIPNNNQSKHPLEKLQRSMKQEGILQVLSIIFLGFVPPIMGIAKDFYMLYYIAYAMLFIISSYYLSTFYRFYKQVNLFSNATKGSLLRIYYELRLAMERYQSFGFLLLPFVFVWLGIYLQDRLLQKGKSIISLSQETQVYIGIGIGITTLLTIFSIVIWVKKIYGRYAKELERIIDNLEE